MKKGFLLVIISSLASITLSSVAFANPLPLPQLGHFIGVSNEGEPCDLKVYDIEKGITPNADGNIPPYTFKAQLNDYSTVNMTGWCEGIDPKISTAKCRFTGDTGLLPAPWIRGIDLTTDDNGFPLEASYLNWKIIVLVNKVCHDFHLVP